MDSDLKIEKDDFEGGFIAGRELSEFLAARPSRFFCASSNRETYYSNIFPLSDLDALLSAHLLHRPAIRMAKDGVVVPQEDICYSMQYGKYAFENVVDVNKVINLLGRGYTLNVRGAHYFHESLRKACSILSDIANSHVRANLYLTPYGESGLAPHFDIHDVFIIQLQGRKRWSFYTNNFPLPIEEDRAAINGYPVGSVSEELDTKPGDLLFIPRGVSHSAIAPESSLHITFGLEMPTYGDLMESMVDSLRKQPGMRQTIPNIDLANVDMADSQIPEKLLEAVVAFFGDKSNVDSAYRVMMAENRERTRQADTSLLKSIF